MTAQKFPANSTLHNANRSSGGSAPSAIARLVNPTPAVVADSDLLALLGSAMKQKEDEKSVKASRQLLASGAIADGTQRKETEASIRAWEAAREWTTVASVVMFLRQTCSHCGAEHTYFEGFHQRQESRQSRSLVRFIKADKPLPDSKLPRESKYSDTKIPLCNSCGDQFGWELEESEET